MSAGGEETRVGRDRFVEPLRAAGRAGVLLRDSAAFWDERFSPVDRAAALQRERQARGDRLRSLLRQAVFARQGSVYQQLFRHAGCEPGDVDALIRREGVEQALKSLLEAGIYLTVEEQKRERPIVRGSLSIRPRAGWLRNPLRQVPSPLHPGRLVSLYRAMFEDEAISAVALSAPDAARPLRTAFWSSGSHGPFHQYVRASAGGIEPSAAFVAGHPSSHAADALLWGSYFVFVALARRKGAQLPTPSFAPLSDPSPIVEWIRRERSAGNDAWLTTCPSWALSLLELASRRGVSLRGSRFIVGGEPLTARRRQRLEEAGATVVPVYASNETGIIGRGCDRPADVDDVHLATHRVAVIDAGSSVAESDSAASQLFVSVLQPSWPLLILNLSLGDSAVSNLKSCGCGVERLGFGSRLHTIRSYQKLTTAAGALTSGDLIQLIEEVLPTRFGGGPTDYQLVEREAEGGEPILTLVVEPAVGPIDEQAVLAAVYAEVHRASSRFSSIWQDSGWLRVVREPVRRTTHGKILPIVSRATALVERDATPSDRKLRA